MEATLHESLNVGNGYMYILEVRGRHSGEMSRVNTLTMLSSNEWRAGCRHLNITGPSCSYHFIRRSMSGLAGLVGGICGIEHGRLARTTLERAGPASGLWHPQPDPSENLIPEKGKKNHKVTCLLQPGPDVGHSLMAVQHGKATLVMNTVVGRHWCGAS